MHFIFYEVQFFMLKISILEKFNFLGVLNEFICKNFDDSCPKIIEEFENNQNATTVEQVRTDNQ